MGVINQTVIMLAVTAFSASMMPGSDAAAGPGTAGLSGKSTGARERPDGERVPETRPDERKGEPDEDGFTFRPDPALPDGTPPSADPPGCQFNERPLDLLV